MSLTLGSQPIEVDVTGYSSISVNSPLNWNGSNIINGDASQTWSTTNLSFINSSFPSLPVTYDLTSNTFSHVTIYAGTNNVTFQINSANTAGVQSFGAGGTNNKLVTANSTLDLSHTTVSGFSVTSTNGVGTTFTVGDLGTAFQIAGGSGNDTLIAQGITLTANQRTEIFATSSIETITDQTGTYGAPPLSPDLNEAPSAVALSNTTALILENSSTATPIKVADIVVTDDVQGSNTLNLTGTDAAFFEILGNALYLKAGTVLDYEAKTSYSVAVTVDDLTVGATPDATSATYTLNVSDVNEAPSAVALSNTTALILENSSTATPIKVADIVVTDDVQGSNTLNLTGTDAAFFEILGNALYLKAGTVLDYEAKTSYSVAVTVDDLTVGATPDATSATYTLNVSDVNEAPSAVALSNTTALILENSSTATPIKVADIVVTDDVQGSNTLNLTGTDAAFFEILGNALYLKAGTVLDYEAKTSYSVAVTVDDLTVGATPDVSSATFTIGVTNVGGVTINGTKGNNTITASATVAGQPFPTNEEDIINGGGGNDTISGLGGADTLDGGAGTNTVTYAASALAVNVSLATGHGSGGDADGDILINIQNLTGSSFNDTLEGNDSKNVLIGGAGVDTVSYAHAAAAVTVNLATSKAQKTGGADTDTLSDFENLTGSSFSDVLTGSSGANVIIGGDGNDTIMGGGGADILTGGSGTDKFVFAAGGQSPGRPRYYHRLFSWHRHV